MLITASRIHDGKKWLPQGTTIEIDENGKVINIHAAPTADTVHYEGLITPGFVNVHCHLELSHMKGVIPEHTGLIPFLQNVTFHRNDHTEEQKINARSNAYNELINNGVVAVGDIANTPDTIDLRAKDKLHFQTFVEALGFTEANAERSMGFAVKTYETFAQQTATSKILQQSIVPHAPYSVSSALFKLIDKHTAEGIMAIHNQESIAEGQFYKTKEGNVRELLKTLGIDDSLFTPTGKSSLQSYLEWCTPDKTFIFVHNTFTQLEDVEYAQNKLKEVFWCLCPNANLYIEKTLPDINMLMRESNNLCIGTDSLASNHQLSVMAELHSIKQQYPNIDWVTLLHWATHNGARALKMDSVIGTIETGKTPGILQITGLEGNNIPVVKRLI